MPRHSSSHIGGFKDEVLDVFGFCWTIVAKHVCRFGVHLFFFFFLNDAWV